MVFPYFRIRTRVVYVDSKQSLGLRGIAKPQITVPDFFINPALSILVPKVEPHKKLTGIQHVCDGVSRVR